MKKYLTILILFSTTNCLAQHRVNYDEFKYIGWVYKETLNRSFINKVMTFAKGHDTIEINQKLPIDQNSKKIFDPGIFYSCQLDTGRIYSLTLQKITSPQIPKEYHSYYKTNAVFGEKKKKSKFREVRRNTTYKYLGNYEKYLDIKNELYEIVNLKPPTGCSFQH